MEREDLAARLRQKLLRRMEKMVDEFPEGAVTETKSQQDDVTRMFKLRDLTAAFKDLAGGAAPASGGGPEGGGGSEDGVEDLSPIAELAGEDAWEA